MVVVVMGVSGSGKSTVARMAAERAGGVFLDADDFHPPANVAKMAAGIPLGDADRGPWLDALAAELRRRAADPQPVVLACSALKERYRRVLRAACPDLRLVYLRGGYALIEARLRGRPGHFMKAGMLRSQLADLEEPADALVLDVDQPVEALAAAVAAAMR